MVLSNNKLTKFEYTEGCLDSLHVLDLSGNRVNTVPVSLMKLLPSLDTIDFSSNPLICDCDLAEFHEFALDERDDFLNQAFSYPEPYSF